LKPENILLDSRGVAKLGDFGVSHVFEAKNDLTAHREGSLNDSASLSDDESEGEFFNETSAHDSPPHPRNMLTRKDTDAALAMKGMSHYGMLTKTEGTWCFWSPEMCEGSQAFSGYAADMWAAGVCLYIFVTGLLPFYSEIPTELFEKITAAQVNYDGYGLSNSLVDLLGKCLEKDPDKRAGVGDCLKHPALQVARSKRVKQLCAELELSRKHKVTLTEEDIRMAFRMVTRVPTEIIRSAKKRLSEARERLSFGLSTPSTQSVSNDSGERDGFFRHKISSLASSGHSSASELGREHHPFGFFHRYSSMDSSHSKNSKVEEEEHASDVATHDNTVTTRKDRLNLTVSSFGSAGSGEDLDDITRVNGELIEGTKRRDRNDQTGRMSGSFCPSPVDVKTETNSFREATIPEGSVYCSPLEVGTPVSGTTIHPIANQKTRRNTKCAIM
jgi:serine/threonine protein kinase